MRDKRFWFCAVVLFGGMLMASSALAGGGHGDGNWDWNWNGGGIGGGIGGGNGDGPDFTCFGDARDNYGICAEQCAAGFRNDLAACGKDPGCADGCREAYVTCVTTDVNPTATELGDCKKGCGEALTASLGECAKIDNQRLKARCVDFVERIASSCVRSCIAPVLAKVALCQSEFATCAGGCPAEEK